MNVTLPEHPRDAFHRASGDAAIEGRFRLVRAIGEGGMGVVWEAIEVASGEPRAIKFLRPETETEAARRRFLREAEVLRSLSHPNVVTIHEIAVDDDGTLAIVMELLRGESLAARLARTKTLSLGQTCAILARVANAVKVAHASGVVHRDLKPDNVFLCVDASGRTDVRVLDFGVAKKLEAVPDKLTDTGTLVGTPHYMSPEQASGEQDLDGKTDVWAVAVMAFECLTGQMPIIAANYGQLLMQLVLGKVTKLAAVRGDLPPDFLAAVDAALATRLSRSDMGTFASALVMRADPAIEPPPAGGASLPAVARTVDMRARAAGVVPTPRSFTGPPAPAARSRGPLLLAGFLALGAIGAAGIVASRSHAPAPSPSITVATAPPPSATAIATAEVPSATASASASAPAASSAAVTSKRPPPKPTGRTPPAAPPSATGGRLQGGVGADVPF